MNAPPLLQRCTFVLGLWLLLAGCRLHPTEREVQRSFYYWKTEFRLDTTEQNALKRLEVNSLFVRFYDVDWNEARGMAEPVGKINFREAPPQGTTITPVVYITQEVLRRSDSIALDTLAVRIARLVDKQAGLWKLKLSGEVQMDCDWTANNKEKYFRFLRTLRQQPLLRNRILSATVRLHQLKYRSQSGIPPVDRGLLMCYNMGNLRDPKVRNSILDTRDLKGYIDAVPSYPLPLDVALPLFDWWVLFEGEAYKGLVDRLNVTLPAGTNRLSFDRDTTLGGYSFRRGQWLRHEQSEPGEVLLAGQLVSRKLKSFSLRVLLYHLDRENLANFTPNELESFYRCFR